MALLFLLLYCWAGGLLGRLGPAPRGQRTGEYVIKWRGAAPATPQHHTDRVRRLARDTVLGVRLSRPGRTGHSFVRFATDADAQRHLSRIAALDYVAYIEPDFRTRALRVPNDARYNEQWDFRDPDSAPAASASYGLNLPGAWDRTTGAEDVVVAVVDTGVRFDHEDLRDKLLPGYDFISDLETAGDGDGWDDDASDPGDFHEDGFMSYSSSWHGTHCSGTVGAATDNGVGVAGVGWNAKVLPVRTLGRGGGALGEASDGILWAVGLPVNDAVPANPHPARVVSLSFGADVGYCPEYLQSAIDSAVAVGAVVVAAAGNAASDAAGTVPCSCAGVVCVGAHDAFGKLAWYSNFGPSVDLLAPGGQVFVDEDDEDGEYQGMVLSTGNLGLTVPAKNGYITMIGTSMATPHISGLAALMLALKPNMWANEVLLALRATARLFPASDSCTPSTCGAGLADAAAAVEFVAENVCSGYCQNGGTCIMTNKQPSCVCPAGQSGPLCEVSDCYDDFCLYRGTCNVVQGHRSCDCTVGWNGLQCSRMANQFCEGPVRLSCDSEVGGYLAAGGNVSVAVPQCGHNVSWPVAWYAVAVPRGLSGLTVAVVGPPNATTLLAAYAGDCDAGDVGDCAAGPGTAATLQLVNPPVGPFLFVVGKSASNWAVAGAFNLSVRCAAECSPAYCLHGGLCTVTTHHRLNCTCPHGWIGDRCEVKEAFCTESYCANGGLCTVVRNVLYCNCSDGWNGARCETAGTCTVGDLEAALLCLYDEECELDLGDAAENWAPGCARCVANHSRDLPGLAPRCLAVGAANGTCNATDLALWAALLPCGAATPCQAAALRRLGAVAPGCAGCLLRRAADRTAVAEHCLAPATWTGACNELDAEVILQLSSCLYDPRCRSLGLPHTLSPHCGHCLADYQPTDTLVPACFGSQDPYNVNGTCGKADLLLTVPLLTCPSAPECGGQANATLGHLNPSCLSCLAAHHAAPLAVARQCVSLPNLEGTCSSPADTAVLLSAALCLADPDCLATTPAGPLAPLSPSCTACLGQHLQSPEAMVAGCLDVHNDSAVCHAADVALALPLLNCTAAAPCQPSAAAALGALAGGCAACLMANVAVPGGVAERCFPAQDVVAYCSNTSDLAAILLQLAYLDVGLDSAVVLSPDCQGCLDFAAALSPDSAVEQCMTTARVASGTCNGLDVALVVPVLACGGNVTCQKLTLPGLAPLSPACDGCLLGSPQPRACLSPNVTTGLCNASEAGWLLERSRCTAATAPCPAGRDDWLGPVSGDCRHCLAANLDAAPAMAWRCFGGPQPPAGAVLTCPANHCVNGGNCSVANGTTLQCDCPSGWLGPQCDVPEATCTPSPCLNGGNCSVAPNNTLNCSCPAGWNGDRCQVFEVTCSPDHCLHGGNCTVTNNSTACRCAAGWLGDRCQTKEATCTPSPCLNGGNCSTTPHNMLNCSCPVGWSGDHCQILQVTCSPDHCLHGGNCTVTNNSTACHCAAGWLGDRCQTPEATCTPSPCLNGGNCSVDPNNTLNCSCPIGWDGDRCQVFAPTCTDGYCQNSGRCTVADDGGLNCSCTASWGGGRCQDPVCPALYCQNNGTCSLVGASLRCNCPEGYTGAQCETSVIVCDTAYCLHNGSCLVRNMTRTCSCAEGWSGDRCQTRVCTSGYCYNGGSCSFLQTRQRCTCPVGWTGNRCQAAVLSADATASKKLAYLAAKYYCINPQRVDDIVRMDFDQRRGLVESLSETEAISFDTWRKDYIVVSEHPRGFSVGLPSALDTNQTPALLRVTDYGPGVAFMVLTTYDVATSPFSAAGVTPPPLPPGAQPTFLALADRLTADGEVVHNAPFSFTVPATSTGTLQIYSHICDTACDAAAARLVVTVSPQSGQYTVTVDHTSGLSGVILNPTGPVDTNPTPEKTPDSGRDLALYGLLALLALLGVLVVVGGVLAVKYLRNRRGSLSNPAQPIPEPLSLPTDIECQRPAAVLWPAGTPGSTVAHPGTAASTAALEAGPATPSPATAHRDAFSPPQRLPSDVPDQQESAPSGPHRQYRPLEEVEVADPPARSPPRVHFSEGSNYQQLHSK